jgi:hypothetical protein
VLHLFSQLGGEVKPLGHQELLGERLGERAFVTKEFPDKGKTAEIGFQLQDQVGVTRLTGNAKTPVSCVALS